MKNVFSILLAVVLWQGTVDGSEYRILSEQQDDYGVDPPYLAMEKKASHTDRTGVRTAVWFDVDLSDQSNYTQLRRVFSQALRELTKKSRNSVD